MKKDTQIISEQASEHLQAFKEWLQSRRYSPSTIKTYTEALKSFLVYFNDKPVSTLTNQDVINYNTHYILKKICLHRFKTK